jgi:mono/diheme cytochrome c family protein
MHHFRCVRVPGAAIALACALWPATWSLAAERPIALKPGEGGELVASRCASCHSLDYVTINAPFLSAEQWQASVAKMRNFGAPLSDDDARAIVAYLATAYGRPQH